MADETRNKPLRFKNSWLVRLRMTDAAIELLIEKGVFTDTEFKAQLGTERANYLAMLKRLH